MLRVSDLIAAGIVDDECEALSMFPLEELREFASPRRGCRPPWLVASGERDESEGVFEEEDNDCD